MKTTTFKILGIGLALAGFVSASPANVIYTHAAISPQLINAPQESGTTIPLGSLAVQQFDTALGVLNSVQVTITADPTGSGVRIWNVSNPEGTVASGGYNEVPGDYRFQVLVWSGSVGIGADDWISNGHTELFMLGPPGDDLGGMGHVYAMQYLAIGPGNSDTRTGTDLIPFEGTGTCQLDAYVSAQWVSAFIDVTPGSAFAAVYGKAGVQLDLAYNYTPVPEPSQLGLLVGGLIFLARGCRSKGVKNGP